MNPIDDNIKRDFIVFMILGVIFFLFLGSFFLYIIFLYRTRRRMQIEQEKLLKTNFEQSLLQSKIEIREQLLKYVSWEVHDNLGQLASVIKMQLNSIREELTDDGNAKLILVKDTLRKMITDMKTLSTSLDAERLSKADLFDEIQDEILRVNHIGSLKIVLENLVDDEIKLDAQKQTFLFRISQEIINNVLKHANANLLSIKIFYHQNKLILSFTDDGVGFESEEFFQDRTMTRKHHGLRNMKERCALINALIEINSRKGHGTIITIATPLYEHSP